jgi:L-ribulose-5-phosphate 4-epimerase
MSLDPAANPGAAARAESASPGTAASESTGPAAGDVIRRIRHAVAGLHAELVRNGLVTWTSGNVSARVPDTDLLVIKPSGISYAELTADTMVVCDLSGTRVSGEFSPSSDTASHAYIYRHMPAVGGVVHTHSRYATAWAARGEPIPCVITAMADEFGGEIPLGPFAPIGGEEIGRAVVGTLAGHRSPAVLLRSHGVFTVGATPRDAVKAAVMCEDAACTVHLAATGGPLTPLPPATIDALYRRYQDFYGQR